MVHARSNARRIPRSSVLEQAFQVPPLEDDKFGRDRHAARRPKHGPGPAHAPFSVSAGDVHGCNRVGFDSQPQLPIAPVVHARA